MAAVSRNPRPSRRYPMRCGMPAGGQPAQPRRVGEQDGGVEAALAQSAGQTQPGGEGARRGDVLVAEKAPEHKGRRPRDAPNGQVRRGLRSLMVAAAGRDRTASPTQLAARTRMLDQATSTSVVRHAD